MKHSDVIASLRKHAPYLQNEVHKKIADGMAADGLLDHDGAIQAAAKSGHRFGSLTAAEAAEPSDFHAQEVSRILHEVRALGWHDVPTEKTITVHDFDAHVSASRDDDTILRKFAVKGRMAKIGMLA